MKRATGVCLVLILCVTLLPAGCRKKDTAADTGGNPLIPDPAGGAPAKNDVQRGAQRVVNQELLRNFGQYYTLYQSENGRPPRTLEEFKAYVQSDPNARNVAAALDKGWVVLVLDPPPQANQVLAYEKDAYEKWNNRLVLFGDGSVRMMADADFQAALKGQ